MKAATDQPDGEDDTGAATHGHASHLLLAAGRLAVGAAR